MKASRRIGAHPSPVPATDRKPPPSGMQVHLGVLHTAMFFHLRKLLSGVERARFFLDRDAGLDSACLAAFVDAIKAQRADVFVLRSNAKELADVADPSKSVRYLTDFDDCDIEHLARLYRLASLRGVDRFFMQVRRRLSVLERPVATPNSERRAWHGMAWLCRL
jgi:hypothetical protein